MYDSARIQGPIHLGKDISWDDFDTKIIEKLDSLRFSNKPARVLNSWYEDFVDEDTVYLVLVEAL